MTIVRGLFDKPQPSRNLSMEARSRFRVIVDTVPLDFREPGNRQALNRYMALADELRGIASTLHKEGRFHMDSEGVLQAHPLLEEQHQARMAMLELSDLLLCNPEAREKALEK